MGGGGLHVTSGVIFTGLGVLFACFCLFSPASLSGKPREGVLLIVLSFVIVIYKIYRFIYK